MDLESQQCYSYNSFALSLSLGVLSGDNTSLEMTVQNGSNIQSVGKKKRCYIKDPSQKIVPLQEDLNLSLGLGCSLPMSFKHGNNCSSYAGATSPHIEVEQQGHLPVDLELSLTCTGPGLTSTQLTSPDGSVSGGNSISSGQSWCSAHPNQSRSVISESDVFQSPSGSMDETVRSSLHSGAASEMEFELGLAGSSDCTVDMQLPESNLNHRFRIPVGPYISLIDEGSTSGKSPKLGAYMPKVNQPNASTKEFKMPNDYDVTKVSNVFASPQIKMADVRNCSDRPSKLCMKDGCQKGARGASGLCIAHGGGRRCQKPDCKKGAEGRTRFCKAHGGGRRCDHFGCIKSAEGKTNFCIAHGGGRRCSHNGCKKAARGKSGLCIRHGGGKRCRVEGCTKSAEGLSGLCISHGGGRRCEFPNCGKGAQGSTKLCKAHGGGRRCEYEGCTKGAEGSTHLCKGHGGGKRCTFGGGTCTKSVHGGTEFCVAHGGGKRCRMPGCSTSARGKTDFCVKHGGGKRCKHENCDKSAQGSTDFCKAHGGGKKLNPSGHGLSNFQGLRSDEAPMQVSDITEKTCQFDGEMIDSGSNGTSVQPRYHHHQRQASIISTAPNSGQQYDVRSFSGLGHQTCWLPSQHQAPPSNNFTTSMPGQQEHNSTSGTAPHFWQFNTDAAAALYNMSSLPSWSNPDKTVGSGSHNICNMPSWSNLEERVHGGSHVMALLSSGVVKFGK